MKHHLSVLVLAILCVQFSLTTSTASSQASLPTCVIHPTGTPSGRILVLINGINTSAKSYDEMAEGWKYLTDEVSDVYGGYVYFSYDGRTSPSRYEAESTYLSIRFHHVPLLRDILESCTTQPKLRSGRDYKGLVDSFSLVGHSMGGVVAFEYLKEFESSNQGNDWVTHVVTLDSPVNGSSTAAFYNTTSIKPAIIVLPWYLVPSLNYADTIQHSEAVTEMAARAESGSFVRTFNARFAQEMLERGIEIFNLTNYDDTFVTLEDALITGVDVNGSPLSFGKYYQLGRSLRTNIKTYVEASAVVGHNQILDFNNHPEVRNDIVEFLITPHEPIDVNEQNPKNIPPLPDEADSERANQVRQTTPPNLGVFYAAADGYQELTATTYDAFGKADRPADHMLYNRQPILTIYLPGSSPANFGLYPLKASDRHDDYDPIPSQIIPQDNGKWTIQSTEPLAPGYYAVMIEKPNFFGTYKGYAFQVSAGSVSRPTATPTPVPASSNDDGSDAVRQTMPPYLGVFFATNSSYDELTAVTYDAFGQADRSAEYALYNLQPILTIFLPGANPANFGLYPLKADDRHDDYDPIPSRVVDQGFGKWTIQPNDSLAPGYYVVMIEKPNFFVTYKGYAFQLSSGSAPQIPERTPSPVPPSRGGSDLVRSGTPSSLGVFYATNSGYEELTAVTYDAFGQADRSAEYVLYDQQPALTIYLPGTNPIVFGLYSLDTKDRHRDSSPIPSRITIQGNGKWTIQPKDPLAPGYYAVMVEKATLSGTYKGYAFEVSLTELAPLPTPTPTDIPSDIVAVLETPPPWNGVYQVTSTGYRSLTVRTYSADGYSSEWVTDVVSDSQPILAPNLAFDPGLLGLYAMQDIDRFDISDEIPTSRVPYEGRYLIQPTQPLSPGYYIVLTNYNEFVTLQGPTGLYQGYPFEISPTGSKSFLTRSITPQVSSLFAPAQLVTPNIVPEETADSSMTVEGVYYSSTHGFSLLTPAQFGMVLETQPTAKPSVVESRPVLVFNMTDVPSDISLHVLRDGTLLDPGAEQIQVYRSDDGLTRVQPQTNLQPGAYALVSEFSLFGGFGGWLFEVPKSVGVSTEPAPHSASILDEPAPTIYPAWTSFGENWNNVHDLLIDEDILLTATDGGLVRWDVNTKEYSFVSEEHGLVGGAHSLGLTESGHLWIGAGGGVTRISPSSEWQTFTQEDGISVRIPDVMASDGNDIWFGSTIPTISGPQGEMRSCGINRISEDGLLYVYKQSTESKYCTITNAIAGYDGTMWFASGEWVLNLAPDGTRLLYDLKDILEQSGVGDYITALSYSHEGYVWIGTHDGVLSSQNSMGVWTQQTSLSGQGSISALMHDFEGNLWIGYDSGSIRRINEAGDSVLLDLHPTNLSGPVTVIREDSKKRIWFGTETGVTSIDPQGTWSTYVVNLPVISAVSDMALTSSGDLWLSTRNGLVRIDSTDQLTYFADERLNSERSAISVISNDDVLVVAGFGVYYANSSGEIKTFSEYAHTDIPLETIDSILHASNGAWWFGGSAVARLDPNGDWTVFADFPDKMGVQVTAIFEATNGSIWAAVTPYLYEWTASGEVIAHSEERCYVPAIAETSYGVLLFSCLVPYTDMAGGTILRYESRYDRWEKLPAYKYHAIRSMAVDKRDNTWAANGTDGLTVTTVDGQVTHYTRNDGFPTEEALRVAVDDKRGYVWIGGYSAPLSRFKYSAGISNEERNSAQESTVATSKETAIAPGPSVATSGETAIAPDSFRDDGVAPRATILVSSLNVRSGPGVQYPVVGTIDTISWIVLQARNSDSSWLKISVADGSDTEGWVVNDPRYVRVTGWLGILPVR